MHVPEIAERYGILMETFLRNCGSSFRNELLAQARLLQQLRKVSAEIIATSRYLIAVFLLLNAATNEKKCSQNWEKSTSHRVSDFLWILGISDLNCLISSSYEICGFHIEECKSMTSKKEPLWLAFKNTYISCFDVDWSLSVIDSVLSQFECCTSWEMICAKMCWQCKWSNLWTNCGLNRVSTCECSHTTWFLQATSREC